MSWSFHSWQCWRCLQPWRTATCGCFRILAVFASFVAQAHVGLIPTVAGTVLTSFVLAMTSSSRSGLRASAIWPQAMALSFLAMWALPAIEQVTGTPGNVTSILNDFIGPNAPAKPPDRFIHTWADMLFGVLQAHFQVPRGWLLKPSLSEWSSILALALMAALGLAALHEIRRRRRFHFCLAVISLVASAVACWSVSRIRIGVADHDVFWMSALGVVDLGIVVGTWVDLPLTPAASRRLIAGVTIAFAVVSIALVSRELLASERGSHQTTGEPEIIENLTRQLTNALQTAGIGRPLFHIDHSAWGIAAGVLLQLKKDGQAFAVDKSWLTIYEAPLASTGDEDAELSIGTALPHWSTVVQHNDTQTLAEYNGVFIDAFNFGRRSTAVGAHTDQPRRSFR
jgi:hypothetical protein